MTKAKYLVFSLALVLFGCNDGAQQTIAPDAVASAQDAAIVESAELTPEEIQVAQESVEVVDSQDQMAELQAEQEFDGSHHHSRAMKCAASATEEVPGNSKNQGFVLWTHIDGSCNSGAFNFKIRSFGPVVRFSNEEIKIKCRGPGMESMDNWVGRYYGAHAALGIFKGGSIGGFARRSSGFFSPRQVCYIVGHTDWNKDHYSVGVELSYGRLEITKAAPTPEPTPTETPTPGPTPTPSPTGEPGPQPTPSPTGEPGPIPTPIP